ncbi:MAG: hypothetical protein C4294_17620, partial [Nitrospiraceae bacterium]
MQGCFRILTMTVLGIIIASVAFLAGFGYSTYAGSAPAQAPAEFGVFWEAWNIIQKDFYGKLPSSKELTYGAIRGVIKLLNDPHTVFLEPRTTQQETEQLRGDFEGIGATVNAVNDQIVIVAPLPGSPAEKAGIQAGD